MPKQFPHLDDSTFPDLDNVDVYKYANDFDYSRFDYAQMRLQLCNVPWDMGEAHIGARTISGIGNVVYFDSTDERDAWFAAIPDNECYRFETKYKELHRSNQIDLPIPFDMAAQYNYLVVDYSQFANDDSPVEYEGAGALKRWFWFVREVEMIAPNTTRLYLLNDAWQTFIYDLHVSGMILERGHAPMVETSAETYLDNPIANCGNLLHEDVVNPNAVEVARNAGEMLINSGADVYAVIITTANPRAGANPWGTKADNTWSTPAQTIQQTLDKGVPACFAFATAAGNLSALLTRINADIPQFFETVKGVFFIDRTMLQINASTDGFMFGNVQCYVCDAVNYTTYQVADFTIGDFGYPDNYADIAKLYTYPYAYAQMSDQDGNTVDVRIENTNGKVTYSRALNLVFPFIKVNAHMTSTGAGSVRTITFRDVIEHRMPIKGNWYETLQSWDIPIFGLVQSANKHNDYATHYDRLQDNIALTNAYNSSVASADAAKSNAYDSAAASKTNVDRSALAAQQSAYRNADTATDIADLQIAANTANEGANETYVNEQTRLDVVMNGASAVEANIVVNGTTNNQIAATEQQAAVAAASAAVSAGTSAITSALSGNIAGAVGSLVGGATQAATTMAQAGITINLASSQASLQASNNTAMATLSNAQMNNKTSAQVTNMQALRDNTNDLTEGSADASAAAMKANADRSYNATTDNTTLDKSTAEGNADRDNTTARENAGRSRNTAESQIANSIAQAALSAPMEFGTWANGDSATTRAQGLFCNVVTQDPFSIAYAGDEMLRYGYMFDRQWPFDGNWNVCSHFTYWKLRDFWVTDLSIPDMYVDKIRFFLFGGVTVWRKPEDIGRISLYDNIDWS